LQTLFVRLINHMFLGAVAVAAVAAAAAAIEQSKCTGVARCV
jgi:hypothetical protein